MRTLLLLWLLLPGSALAQFVNDPLLPPPLPWQGASESLILSPDHPHATPAEQWQLTHSPDLAVSTAWLDELVASSDLLHKVSLGLSPQGRPLWMIVASHSGSRTPGQLRANGLPTLLVQAGIHAGEIDGKDAGMMLLRDMVLGGKRALLEGANLLFVPVFNVDGHERRSRYSRVNQRGPDVMGWRTSATNLNLNRDYAKADTPEMQSMLAALNRWQPHLYIDVHVTDGIDYQYDLTYGYNLPQGLSPASYDWLQHTLRPRVDAALIAMGHQPGPLVFAIDNTDLSQGLSLWNPSPRYSNGYGDARHLPTILVENHSLKPYRQRVLATYVMLEATLKQLAQSKDSLLRAIDQDRRRYPDPLTLTWHSRTQPKGWDFKGVGYTTEISAISGAQVIRWNGQPKLYPNLPVIGNTEPGIQVNRPRAYLIPPQWQQVIDRLRLHGIQMTQQTDDSVEEVESYRLLQPRFADRDYEGRQRVSATLSRHYGRRSVPAGSWRIDTSQPLGDLAMLLLEPQSPDSLLQWGLFNPIFTRTEYIEDYAVEPLAQKMLETEPGLKTQFEQKLAQDPEFKRNPKARLRWFYEKSSYFDSRFGHYPVLRINKN